MSMTSLDAMKTKVATMLKGIERYNPENIQGGNSKEKNLAQVIA